MTPGKTGNSSTEGFLKKHFLLYLQRYSEIFKKILYHIRGTRVALWVEHPDC